MSYVPGQELDKTAFGETVTAQPTPIAQIMAPYGQLEKAESFLLNGGTASSGNSLFEISSGTSSDGFAATLTRRQVTYRPGQGILARFTAVFDTPQINNVQQAGFIVNADRFVFGYNEAGVFGVGRYHDGESEIQELTITAPAGGAENATITVDGNAYVVPLTAGTVQHNAYEISESLNSQVSEYDFSSNNDQVVARSVLFGAGNSFAFSSGTAVASWSQVVAGMAPTPDFVAAADWDTPMPDLDPQKGNVFQIRSQYLGFGAIKFYIEDTDSGDFMEVHRIKYANTSTSTTVGNPTFRVGWLTQNSGNTTNVSLKGASAAGFVEGISVVTEPPRAIDNTDPAVGTGVLTNILTIRNRLVLDSRRNRNEAFPLEISASTDSSKGVLVRVLAGATVTGDLDFQYIDKDNSIVEFAKDAVPVTNGRLVYSFTLGPSGEKDIDLKKFDSVLLPGETYTIAAQVVSGAASTVTITSITQEDL